MRDLDAFTIATQPDESTCGPTCLQAVYGFYDDPVDLERVIGEVTMLEEGGTLGALLGQHALRRRYRATLHPYNLLVFDPTWMGLGSAELIAKLEAQSAVKRDPKLRLAIDAYRGFLELGGRIAFRPLTRLMLRQTLRRGTPVIVGLSATYLYQSAREVPTLVGTEFDDVAGVPTGHFVVLCGYDAESRQVAVADPYGPARSARASRYWIDIDRLVGAILLGVLTWDANLLILEPPKGSSPR
ncbi:MAG TPA: hypothetical protein VMV46_08630 [Thermoanaerobaculia bacterium]|nr:hypothetical protein [Thermoanaerobaculia bacterium]